MPWIVNPLMGSLSIITFYFIGKEIYDERTARIAALLGLPLPANSQGEILLDSLSITEELEEQLVSRRNDQQRLLAEKVPDASLGDDS